MSKVFDTIREKSVELVLSGVAGLLLILIGIVVNSFGGPFLEKVLPEIASETLLAIAAILLLLLVLSLIGLIILRSRLSSVINRRDFTFDKRAGLYKNKADNIYYCVSCMANNRLSPLLEREDGWLCMIKSCEQFYHNPDYHPDPGIQHNQQPLARPWDSF